MTPAEVPTSSEVGEMAEPAVAEAAALLGRARRVVVFTGAGMSAESGVPTFRDALTGLWRRYDPQALATPEAFHADPALVWGPAAEVPQVAARCGGTVIQINPQPTPLDAVAQVNLRGPAAQLLPALVRAAWDA